MAGLTSILCIKEGLEFMRLLIQILCLTLLWLYSSASIAGNLTIDNLRGEDCSYFDEQTETESISYWRRYPPFVGFRKGEKLLAGGDGTCVLGFPKSKDGRALISVNGKKITVFSVGDDSGFKSADGSTFVELKVTGTESTCVAGEDKCCGDYTYVTITVHLGGKKSQVRAATYSGG